MRCATCCTCFIIPSIRKERIEVDQTIRAISQKDRVTTFPVSVIPFLKSHLDKVKLTHQNDLKRGYGEVYLPHALARKYSNAACGLLLHEECRIRGAYQMVSSSVLSYDLIYAP